MKDSQEICPALRQDLEIISGYDKNGSLQYYIKNPASEDVFVLEEGEYFLCKQLNGHTSLHDIKLSFKNHFNISLDLVQLKALINQLGNEGLLEGYAAKPKSIINSLLSSFLHTSPETWKKWILFNPQRQLARLSHCFKWCYTRIFVIISITIFLLAIGVLYNNFTEFLKDFNLLVMPLSLFQMLAVLYLCFNIPYQIVRGMTIIHFGGHVEEFGIQLVFDFMPLFYCKGRISEIRERSDRNWIFFAATFYAILLASMGMLCWKMTSPSLALHTFGITLAVIGTISTITFLNFLWPSDIAFLLSNWLEIPDFRNRAINVFEAWLFLRPLPEPLTSREKRLFAFYGPIAGIITLLSIAFGLYFLAKLLIKYFSGTGALILLLVVMVKYRKLFSQWFKRSMVAQNANTR